MQIFGFPVAVFFIISNEFCERFSYYGMKAILIIYLTAYVKMEEDSAVALTHGFNMICYATPLLGAIIADSYLGKFKTILYISLLYAVGNVVMAVTAFPKPGGESLAGPLIGLPGPLIALVLIGFGTGGIKPCVAAFGGDQFSESEEGKLSSFFSLFYAAINAGSVLSMLITPLLRGVACLGQDSCYPLAFGIPAGLMLVAIGVFVLGDFITKYNKKTPEGNVFGDVVRCICYALKRKWRAPKDDWRRHWLDWADDRFSARLISDIKCVLNIFTVFIPLPMFWALYEQQGTRWTLQAQRLDGLGILKPDQMQVLNAFLILCFIPIFDKGIYPLCNKLGLAMRPLQRVGIGLLLTAASFVASGILESAMESQDLHAPTNGFGYITVINNLDQNITVKEETNRNIFPDVDHFAIEKYQIMNEKRIEIDLWRTEKIHGSNVTSTTFIHPRLFFETSIGNFNETIPVQNMKGVIAAVVKDIDGRATVIHTPETIAKPPQAQVWINYLLVNKSIPIYMDPKPENDGNESVNPLLVAPGEYSFSLTPDAKKARKTHFGTGGTYTILFKNEANNNSEYTVYTNTEPNKYAIFWQIPQYVIITMGEIMVSITGLSFAYSQAPDSMKAVLQSGWLLTTFVGNAIVVIVLEAQHGGGEATKLSHSKELFLFAGLCVLCTLIFALLAMNYTYVNVVEVVVPPESLSKVSPGEPYTSGEEIELEEHKANGTSNLAYDD